MRRSRLAGRGRTTGNRVTMEVVREFESLLLRQQCMESVRHRSDVIPCIFFCKDIPASGPGASEIEIKEKARRRITGTCFSGSGIGIRTPTNRVRVCRATFTQFRFSNKEIIANGTVFVKMFLHFFRLSKSKAPAGAATEIRGAVQDPEQVRAASKHLYIITYLWYTSKWNNCILHT